MTEGILSKRSDGEAKEVKGSIKEAIGKIIGSPEIEDIGSVEKSDGRKQAAKAKARDDTSRGSATDQAAPSTGKPIK